jgi:hypothetical protein
MMKCKHPDCTELLNKRSLCTAHRMQTPGQIRAKKKYADKNKDKLRAATKRYRDSEHGKAMAKAYWATPVCRYNQLKKSQRKRGVPFLLTLEEYSALITASCDYCQGPLPVKGAGLDRLDSNLGYEKGNIVPCCTFCNRLKADLLTYEETKAIILVLKKLRDKGNIWEGFKWGGAKESGNALLVKLLTEAK